MADATGLPIRVTVYDPATGDTDTREIQPGDYAIVCAAPCYRAEVQADLVAGTHLITVEGVRRG